MSTSLFPLFCKFTHIYTRSHNSPCLIIFWCVYKLYVFVQSSDTDELEPTQPLQTKLKRTHTEHMPSGNAYICTLSSARTGYTPPSQGRVCSPDIFAYPPLENHLILISAKVMGEECYCIPVLCYMFTTSR